MIKYRTKKNTEEEKNQRTDECVEPEPASTVRRKKKKTVLKKREGGK